jgi:hypothetical protein
LPFAYPNQEINFARLLTSRDKIINIINATQAKYLIFIFFPTDLELNKSIINGDIIIKNETENSNPFRGIKI